MKVSIEISDKVSTLDALNNAMVSFGDIITAFFLGVQVPAKWAMWAEKNNYDPDEAVKILRERMDLLKDIYEQIDSIDEE